jgi:uncharacterized membrane protein (UPF0182 family)
VIGGIYPAIVQQFQVRPNEPGKESPLHQPQHPGDQTGVQPVQRAEFGVLGDREPDEASLAADKGTLDNIRILDPAIVSPTFRQLQQIRTFYSFPDTLDVDRYQLPRGRRRAPSSAPVRSTCRPCPPAQRNWANDTLVYTHGYGLVAAYDNTANSEGEPEFFAEDIPPTGELEIDQPRVYFGEKSPPYSIVGGPGGLPRELDFPDDTSPSGTAHQHLHGIGGVGRLAAEPDDVRGEVLGAEHPVVQPHRRRLQDPVRPRSADPREAAWRRGCGWTPTRTRQWSRAHRVARRRLHHHRLLPELGAAAVGRRDQ